MTSTNRHLRGDSDLVCPSRPSITQPNPKLLSCNMCSERAFEEWPVADYCLTEITVFVANFLYMFASWPDTYT